MILEKYDFEGFYDLGLLVLRLFATFENFHFLNYTGINTICSAFLEIHSKSTKLFYENLEIDNYGKECLLNTMLTTKDYIYLVEAFSLLLEQCKNPHIRTNPVLMKY